MSTFTQSILKNFTVGEIYHLRGHYWMRLAKKGRREITMVPLTEKEIEDLGKFIDAESKKKPPSEDQSSH